MKVRNILVVTDRASAIAELVSGAKQMAEKVTLVYSGSKEAALGADKAYWLGELSDNSFVNYMPGVVELQKELNAEIVFCSATANGRLAAAHLAVASHCPVFSDVSKLSLDEDGIISERMCYGGAAFKTEKAAAKAVVVVGDGVFEVAEHGAVSEIADLSAVESVSFCQKNISEEKQSNLPAAKRVLSVGRGVKDEQMLGVVNEFAGLLGCEVGCTRPVAEDTMLMPKDTYIGISGLMLKPDLYIGVGTSGQIQHTIGVNTAKTIIAINKDKDAPIFAKCDYGIVANIEDVVPKLIERFK